ncbi:MAG: DUF1501 domain-containing protein [Planctomycetota bacterium]
MSDREHTDPRLLDRRQLLTAGGSMALLGLLARAGLARGSSEFFTRAARAKHVIYLFMFGGPSQMDLFDYKPELQRMDGKTIQYERKPRYFEPSTVLGSQRKFKQWGETGQWCSDAFQHIPKHIDKMAVVKSLYTDSFAHGPALLQMNSGQPFPGHPSMGSWVSYGMGSGNADLPAFVVMQDPRGGPISGPANWSSGYMPANHQGTLFRSRGEPVLDLSAGPRSVRGAMDSAMQRAQLDLLHRLNTIHADGRAPEGASPEDALTARDASYELAFHMQTAAREALDLSQEDEATKEMYGLYDPAPSHRLSAGPAPFGTQCLMARRLVERGVRFVQIYHGGGHQQQTWDAHQGVEENLAIHCPEVDRPIAGLLTDLERTGLLDETLVVWGGEFGRQHVAQTAGDGQVANSGGRGHNPHAFTMWLAGAGVKPGSFGETDELGARAERGRHHVRDMHATILNLLGLDHEKLSFYFGGLDRRLTGVFDASVIREILA